MAEEKIMKDLGLNDPMAITLPVHTWLSFLAAYQTADWSCGAAHSIGTQIQDGLLDPDYLKGRLAVHQEAHDAAEMTIARMFGHGHGPGHDHDPNGEHSGEGPYL